MIDGGLFPPRYDFRNSGNLRGSWRISNILKEMRGDSAAKSRLLAALLRAREIPARIVYGVTLTKGPEQRAHYWVEAWSQERSRWLPLCPFHHQVVIHRWGWTLKLNPDGTTTAWNPDHTKILHSHGPPARAG